MSCYLEFWPFPHFSPLHMKSSIVLGWVVKCLQFLNIFYSTKVNVKTLSMQSIGIINTADTYTGDRLLFSFVLPSGWNHTLHSVVLILSGNSSTSSSFTLQGVTWVLTNVEKYFLSNCNAQLFKHCRKRRGKVQSFHAMHCCYNAVHGFKVRLCNLWKTHS